MISKDFFAALDQVAAERNMTKEEIIKDFEEAMVPAIKKMQGEGSMIRVVLDYEKKKIRVYAYKVVVDTDDVEDWDTQISLDEAQEIKKSYKVGDEVVTELNLKDFGRVAAITIKQVMAQKNRERTRQTALEEINARADQIVTAKITKIERDIYTLEIPGSGLEGVLNVRGQVPGQVYRAGDFLKVYINPVFDDRRGEIYVTRSTPQFIRALFDLEVPEINRGEVTVKAIAREAGYRTKICVHSDVANIDPIGACVGPKGSRINTILQEIAPEKIDLIPWFEDPLEFIAAALAPSPVLRVEADEEQKRARVVVPNDKLSLAIGRSGLNVRLAAKLTGWKIDVLSEEKAAAADASFAEDFVLGGDQG